MGIAALPKAGAAPARWFGFVPLAVVWLATTVVLLALYWRFDRAASAAPDVTPRRSPIRG